MTKKFKRILSSDDYFELHEKYEGNIFDTIYDVEQAVLAKLAEQEPVACVSSESFSSDGTSDIMTKNLKISTKLYTHPIPCVSHASDKTGCVSEKAESETQASSQVNLDSSKLELARHQPCGCVVCYCENQVQCLGCGAEHCGTHDLGEIPNPVYVDHIPDAGKMLVEMYWINPDYPSSDSIIEAFEPITSSVEVNVGDRYEVSRAIRLPDMTVEVTELEENGDVKSYKIVGGDHITEPVLD